jgi:hypothetical protein
MFLLRVLAGECKRGCGCVCVCVLARVYVPAGGMERERPCQHMRVMGLVMRNPLSEATKEDREGVNGEETVI